MRGGVHSKGDPEIFPSCHGENHPLLRRITEKGQAIPDGWQLLKASRERSKVTLETQRAETFRFLSNTERNSTGGRAVWSGQCNGGSMGGAV